MGVVVNGVEVVFVNFEELQLDCTFPYLILVNSLIPALLAGNTAILKPSSQTPLVASRIVEIFATAGLPPNVLQVLHCATPALLTSIITQLPSIALVTYVGSTSGGLSLRAAAAAAAGQIVPVVLELGGNDPAYVRGDAGNDVAWVAAQVVDGAVFNAGQSCCAVERVYVHADVHDAFVAAVRKELAGIYVRPTVLVDVPPDARVMREETFGLVVPIARVESDEEAVALMNDSVYGLTASVWTKDVRAGEELVEKIEAGTIFVNRCDYPSPLKSYHIKETEA
ncbi:putative potassium-activated aldehyde dehydrogenase [Diplodia seriata]|uniref:aldehyde dehydrogenase (NAD(+)) n=1 Tax=Diplodia seriata TaxID=420778 RepID=A0A0G2DT10_9PEZI|nr:putative potassium-activated aldehyde dehydrogenase [Diplodia seriata]